MEVKMKHKIEEFFKKDEEAFYDCGGTRKFRGVKRYYNDTVRNDKAVEQSKLAPVPISNVFAYVNEFLEALREENGHKNNNIRCKSIDLDNTQHVVFDNGIIVKDLIWTECQYDKVSKKYTKWDTKYDKIKEKFNLKNPFDIVWLKFTDSGHVGVVAKSFDINFRDDLSSGVLVKEVCQAWDKSFVLVFPMTSEILGNHKVGDIELAVGNYLISKGVPIIDFYSHNN